MALTRIVNGRPVEMTPKQEADFLKSQQSLTPPSRYIPKSVVVQRLIEAGKIDDAYVALSQNPSALARWFSPDQAAIPADSPEAIALLESIGADPAVILA